MVIGVEYDYCTAENISKTINGSLQLRILPMEQTPTNPPVIKLPLDVDVCYPQAEFRSCDQAEFAEYSGLPQEEIFEKLDNFGSIDFGSTIPGTPINRYIYVKNVSVRSIQLNWELSNFQMDNCRFDINPS